MENEIQSLKRQRTSEPSQAEASNAIASTPPISLHSPPQLGSGSNLARGLTLTNPVEDLSLVPLPLIHHLVETWFKDCQPWAPIIRRPDIQLALQSLTYPVRHIDCVVLRAVLALTMSFSSQLINFGYEGRRRISEHLRSQVLSEALAKISLSSLQALLIICILDYGADDIPSSWSLLSVCRRLCEQLGLFAVLQTQIEQQTPTSIGPPSRARFDSQDLAVPLTWVTLSMDSSWTLGAGWRDASASIMEHLSSIAYRTAPDFTDSFRTLTHLGAIGLQPLHLLFWQQEQQKYSQSEAAILATCNDIYENFMTYRRSQTLPTYRMLQDGSVDFDPNAVLTSTLANGATIALYQPHIDFSEMSVAYERCLAACDDVITTIRSVSDADIELNSPSLGSNIFAVTRFKLASYRAASKPREPSVDVLMHGLNMCGRRFPYARRVDIVLRAAIAEVDATANGRSITQDKIPEIFWDLKQSAVDINESMKEWVLKYRPSLYVGSLNGPYA